MAKGKVDSSHVKPEDIPLVPGEYSGPHRGGARLRRVEKAMQRKLSYGSVLPPEVMERLQMQPTTVSAQQWEREVLESYDTRVAIRQLQQDHERLRKRGREQSKTNDPVAGEYEDLLNL